MNNTEIFFDDHVANDCDYEIQDIRIYLEISWIYV